MSATVNTRTIDWQAIAGTVYGGYIHVKADGSAELVVTHAEVDLGTLSWTLTVSAAENHIFQAMPSPAIAVESSYEKRKTGFLCSSYPASRNISISASMDDKSMLRYSGYIFVRDTAYSDVPTFTTAMSGVQLVYELATPITYQLDPITVETLLGQNTIWADSGDVDLTYIKKSLLRLGS